jgi:hypothetical protein
MTTQLHSDANHLRTTREAFVKTIVAAAVFSPLSLATAGDALGREALVMPPTSRPFRRMGTIGLTLAERLRVSLFRHDDPEIPTDPCGYRIRLLGLDGELLGFGKGEIAPERGAFSDFEVAALVKAGERVQAHIEVEFETYVPVGVSAEVVDAKTNFTTAIPQDASITPAPSLVQMGTVGIGTGQFARVSVFHHAEAGAVGPPCDFAIRLLGLDGQLVAQNAGSLAPGKGSFFDYDPASALAKGERVQVHADVHMPPNPQGGLPMLGATLEIVDAKSGRTAIPSSPCGITDLQG